MNKIDKFIKSNIARFRAKGIPLILAKDKIAVGNILITKKKDSVLLDDLRNDSTLKLNFVYSAVLLAKYIELGCKPSTFKYRSIIDYDRKLEKYLSDTKLLNKQITKTKNVSKVELYQNKLDYSEQQYGYWLERLYSLDKWHFRINRIYNFED